jgi:hypothetical protein
MTTSEWMFWIVVAWAFFAFVGLVAVVLGRYLNSRAMYAMYWTCVGGLLLTIILVVIVGLIGTGTLT